MSFAIEGLRVQPTTFDYQSSDMHLRYDAARAIPPGANDELQELLLKHASFPLKLVVDLGSGTGRFTAFLAQIFNTKVIGVEPASNMRSLAESKPHPADVRFVAGSAERIPLPTGTADVIFMSQVFHHIVDRPAALNEIHRVLRPDGRLYLRQTTQENLGTYFYQQFFPGARAIDQKRIPSRETLTDLARLSSFRTIAVETIRYDMAATSAEYVSRVQQRAYSDLQMISDGEFETGLDALRQFADASPDFPKFAENDLLIFAA